MLPSGHELWPDGHCENPHVALEPHLSRQRAPGLQRTESQVVAPSHRTSHEEPASQEAVQLPVPSQSISHSAFVPQDGLQVPGWAAQSS